MKKIILFALATVACVTSAFSQVIPDYVRGSIYSIRLDAPSSSKQDFSKEIAIMTSVFDTLDYKNQYKKYNAFQAGERLMKSTDLPEASEEEAMAIATKNGNKKVKEDDLYAARVLKYLNGKNVGRALVAKWFSKPESEDYTKLVPDDQFTTIMKFGLMSLSEDEKLQNKDAEKLNTNAAKEMVDPQLNSTYVLVTRYDFATPAEQVQDAVNEKLAPLYAKLEKVPAMIKSTIQSTIDSEMQSTKELLESTIKLNAVSAKSYLFKLKWNGLVDFFSKYWKDPDSFTGAEEYELEYVTTTKGTNPLVTEVAGNKLNVNKVVASKSLKVLNKNVNRLAQQYEPFAPVERLYTNDQGQLYVKLGTQDGVDEKTKFTALKKTADMVLAPGGTLSVAKNGLWNNSTDEEDIEANAKAASEGNADLQYTLLNGKAKGCSYVRFGVKK